VASVPATPATPATNQAYASALGGATTANGGYRLGAATGTTFSPSNGNLQAVDNSTDGASLPATANSDAPSPSPVLFPTTIAGNVFEDANYGGGSGRSQATSGGTGVTGAQVELYSASGTTYTFLSGASTNAAGNYVFTTTDGTTPLSGGATYAVRVVNGSVASTRPGSVSTLVGVQTFRTDASAAVTTAVTDHVGGEQPGKTDYPAMTTVGAPLPAVGSDPNLEVQSITNVLTPASGPQASLDFGFNFDAVVNTNDASQGSLRQFIANSNALTNAGLAQVGQTAGKEASIFMVPDGLAHNGQRAGLPTGLAGGVAVITPLTALPALTDANTAIDGTTQTANVGNTNTAVVGTGSTVGTPTATFRQFNGPEVQLAISRSIAGLSITGANATLNGVALFGSNGNALSISGGSATISNNLLGVVATTTAKPAAGVRTTAAQVAITGGSGTALSTNYIGYADQSGVTVASGATAVSIIGNEIRGNGVLTATADGLTVAASGVTITQNLITGSAGMGIDLAGSAGAATITGNTLRGNGVGIAGVAPTKTAGIRVAGSGNNLRNNVLDANYGAGLLVASGAGTTLMSQNSMLNNGTVATANGAAASSQLGIDLLTAADTPGTGTAPFASLNADGKTAASGANGLLNFPIIKQVVTTTVATGSSLQIRGYAPAGSTVEFFVADRTAPAFGQGQTYLFSALEGGTLSGIADRDANATSYSGTINGLTQGSETNAPNYFFIVPLSSLIGAQMTALSTGTARLTATATATANGNTTSEFSGSVTITTNQQPLPVTLSAFEAQAVGANARLSWSTASEENNSHFVVERSLNGTAFGAIGTVQGNGTSSQAHSYGFADANIGARPAGPVYYRLQQVDADGAATFSPVRSLSFAGVVATNELALYPNPATTATTLDLTALAAGAYQVTLVDATGHPFSSGSYAGGAAHPLDVRQAPTGAYFVIVRGQGVKLTKALVKE